ncbi:MAG TPA: Mur ligase family protein, partial [Stellaceae bacterium]|nr:Mur ligase family protein [Stellaceae bacterium]
MSALFALIGFIVFAARRLLTYLHLFQQEEYDGRRFVAWLAGNRGWDRRLSLGLAAIVAAQLLTPGAFLPTEGFVWLAGIACLVAAVLERDPRKIAKKRLVMTSRAKRIYGIALALIAGIGIVAVLASRLAAAWIVAVQLVPLALVAANLLLAPFEAAVQRRYWREARAILERVNPTVIAVTGSYGKTSVKHILGHVLETAGATLITPGSVNTAMGIARVIRERLQPHHRYFVVEMGAYGIGSIARLCALTPPQIGIISAIGKAHYE